MRFWVWRGGKLMESKLVTREQFIQRSAQPGIFIWLTDYLPFDFFAWEIKRHTKNNYNHAMIQTAPGFLCSQNWTFRVVNPGNYLRGKHRVKLIRVPVTPLQESVIQGMARLLVRQAPRYDWMGILGFLFKNQKRIQFRSRFYCSEAVLTILQEAGVHAGETALSPGDIDRMIEEWGWEVVSIYE